MISSRVGFSLIASVGLFLQAAVLSVCIAAAPETGKSSGQHSVAFKDGRLSVSAQNSDLAGLLKDIGAKAGLEVIAGSLTEQRVTVSFKDLSIEEGIRKLLRHHNYFLCYPDERAEKDPDAQGCGKARLVVVKKAGEKAEKKPHTGEPPQARQHSAPPGADLVKEIIAELLSDQPEVRSRGLERLSRTLDSMGDVDPEIMGALRLVMGEETRNSGIAGLREIIRRSEGGRNEPRGN
jgi:hypothetical protein